MCGIIGVVGETNSTQAVDVLLSGLKALEYRGYDSAGMFVAGPEGGLVKAVGEIVNLEEEVTSKGEAFAGPSGIAHTRWATHGEPTVENAHPHTDMTEQLHIVHNGIIENYQSLKEGLSAQGMQFSTRTDTEVLAKLIGAHYEGDLLKAVRSALTMVRGAYGLAAMHAAHPDEIVVARLGSPIVIGVAEDAHYVASDSSALLPYTKRMVYLDDGDVAHLTATSYHVATLEGTARELAPETIEGDTEAVQKGGFEHFMLKEIMEGPQVVRDTLRGRLLSDNAKLGGLEPLLPEITSLKRLTIAACGTACLAGHTARYWLEEYAGIPVEVELASEYRYKTNWPEKNHALLAITQSGETADTLAAVREAKELGMLTLGVVNVVGSTIARETDAGVYNHAGPEVAVASTKAFISQLVVLALITMLVGRESKHLSRVQSAELVDALTALPKAIETVLKTAEQVKAVAEKYAQYEHMMFIGRHSHAPIAAEGALKLKEISYIHAEAYAAGELKHGPIALLDENFPVLALAPHDSVYEKTVSNIEEVKARKAPLIVVVNKGDTEAARLADDVIEVPKVHPLLQPIISVIPLHLFAYYVGTKKGFNVDRPRNLAKSVTVE
ncbi:glutamine--fructose-6-phosphate transaminase (isomerizing) [bacterium]|nr:glutamine--fructose-6-phosphate transaminase (isomerizing) [bacterium]|tara:strand:+ start:7993 stop:9828 length:1836 start_codon:yes stop_codon:yes gene_type:complete